MREHPLHGWTADRAPCSLGNNQCCGEGPASGQSQRRYRQHVYRISSKSDGPIFVCLVGEVSGDLPKAVAHHLAETGDETDDGGACAKRTKKGSDDGSGSFVGHVCEKVDDSDNQDKLESEFCCVSLGCFH